jgi:hypothetical protein
MKENWGLIAGVVAIMGFIGLSLTLTQSFASSAGPPQLLLNQFLQVLCAAFMIIGVHGFLHEEI